MLGRAPLLVTGFLLAMNSAFALAADDPKEVLKDSGLKIVGNYAVQADEAKVTKSLAELSKARKQLIDAAKVRAQKELAVEQNRAVIEQDRQAWKETNTVIANSGQTSAQLVSRANALLAEIEQLQGRSKKLDEESKEARAKANQVREEYVEKVMGVRKLYEEILARYEELSSDEGVKTALETLSEAKPIKLGPMKSFTLNDEKIKKVEDTVLSEHIPLRQEGKVWLTSVVINGKEAEEFCVDTGASLVTIPLALAEKMDMKPTSMSPEILLSVADGRTIKANLVTAKSVRVGKFTVENVECAVMPESATNAPTLLGQSFLEKFSFQIDSAAGQLVMTKVDGEEVGGGKAPPKSKEKPAKSPKTKVRDPFVDPPSLD
jgi:aspartyl protease family protein